MLIVTPGEPAGIGPDLVVLAAQQPRQTPWAVAADADMLLARAKQLGLPLTICSADSPPATEASTITVVHSPLASTVTPGQLDPRNVSGVMQALDEAIAGCKSGHFDGLVTGPMQKSASKSTAWKVF